jgi:rhodanese-related sulfurtransferase
MENIDKTKWKELIQGDENAVILDVRTPDECAEGIQPKAIQRNVLEQDTFLESLHELDANKNYYVYCRSGKRSANACQLMEQEGFNCYNLLGGMLDWDGEVIQVE